MEWFLGGEEVSSMRSGAAETKTGEGEETEKRIFMRRKFVLGRNILRFWIGGDWDFGAMPI